MPTLVWDEVGTRFFETGVDRGVLYSVDGVGVPWSGLTGVTESNEGASSTSLYLDGMKYQEARLYGDFAATIEAFSAPDEFSAHDGTVFDMQGLGFGLQPKKSFGLSYRTLVGNDVDGQEHGYQIHLVYNAIATAGEKSYATLGGDIDPTKFTWDISTTPQIVAGRRPTAHLVIDSRKVDPMLLSILEGYLYGTNGVIPQLPSIQQIVNLFSEWVDLGIVGPVDYEGVFSAETQDIINMATNPSFETTGAYTELRRNLDTNPALNVDSTTWAASAFGAAAARVAITDLPGFAWAFGTLSSDVAIANQGRLYQSAFPVTIGTTYTLSAWVKNGGATTNTFYARGDAASGVGTVMGSATVTPTNGAWQRVSITFTATEALVRPNYTNVGASAVGTAFLITGVLLEASSVMNGYFDGAQPVQLRRNWMLQPAPTTIASNGWVNAGSGVAALAVGARGQKAVRQTRTANSSAVALYGQRNVAGMPTQYPDDVWTVSATIRSSESLVGASGMTFGIVIGSGSTTVANLSISPSAEEQRFSLTYVVPSNASNIGGILSPRIGWGTSSGSTGDWIELSEVLFEKTALTLPYFDGSYGVGVTDTVAWEGTENASASYVYDADRIPFWAGVANASISTLRALITATASASASQSTAYSSRVLPSSGSRVSRWEIVSTITVGVNFTFTTPTSGTVATLLFRVRVSRPGASITAKPRIGSSDWTAAPPFTITDQWQWIRFTYPTGATNSNTGFVMAAGSGHQVGDYIDVDDLCLVVGNYSGPYFDGTSPSLTIEGQEAPTTWTGTPNASTSKAVLYTNLPEVAEDGDARLIDDDLWVRIDGVWRNKGSIPQLL